MFATVARSETVQKTVDWAVFAVGALALTTAIIGTALPSGDARLAQADSERVAPTL